MVIVRNIALKWIRRYKVFFIFGTTILLFHIFLTLKFFAISKNAQDQKWQPVMDPKLPTRGTKLKKLFLSGSANNINKDKVKQPLKMLNFTPSCDITGWEAVSAIGRAKSEKCKQVIANVTCLSLMGKLYPKKLPNYCTDERNNTGKALGCFKDDKDLRILIGYHTTLKDNSLDNCLQLCLQSGFPYAGVEYSNQCFCGLDEPLAAKKLPDSSCNMKCPGKQHETCGGYFAINVFHTGIKKFVPQLMNAEVTDEKPVRIVFLLTLNGRALRQVKRLLKFIYRKHHFYYIHIDVRQDYLFRKLLFLEKRFANVKLTRKRYATIWGGASLLKMLRSSMNELLNLNWKWDFVLNLSESDYPVKTIEKLTEFLTSNRDKNFVKSHGREVQRFIQKQGLDKTFVECDMHMWRVGSRKLPWGVQIDGGSDWVALNRDFVTYVAGNHPDDLIQGLLKVYKYTLLPAESFFHTALRNSVYCNTYVDNNLHITNWKRKLGCKCQYKHVVDWCGCSPNDFKPEDWPRILGTELRQVYFARKFEPVISQSIIYQLELWLTGPKYVKTGVKSLNSYWQSLYHYEDLEDKPEGLLSVARAAVRNFFGNENCSLNKIIEITSYHHKDNYKYTLVKGKTTQGIFELAFKNLENFETIRKTPITEHIQHLSVNSEYDQKEQTSRNFPRILSPYSDLILIHQFSPEILPHNISFLFIDPTGQLVDVTEVNINENNLNGHTKIELQQPHKHGIWNVKLIHENEFIYQLKFPIFPLETNPDIKTQPSEITKKFDEHFVRFEPDNFEKQILIKNLNGLNLLKWIDVLFSKFYVVEKTCTLKNTEICNRNLNFCTNSTWSSYYADPKSHVGNLNITTGTFDLWL